MVMVKKILDETLLEKLAAQLYKYKWPESEAWGMPVYMSSQREAYDVARSIIAEFGEK
jgi:hypothetical protein